MDLIFKPATKILEAIIDTDDVWNKNRTADNDKAKMRTLNSVLTRVIPIYNTYGFYVKPTKEVKEKCPKLYEWLTSKDITQVESLNFRGKHDPACTNLPIVLSVISLMIEKKSLVPTAMWSKRVTVKGTLKTAGRRDGNHDVYAHPYSILFGCQFDVALDGVPLPGETKLLKRSIEQIFNCLVYARQKPLLMVTAKQMESKVIDDRFFKAVNKAIEDMTWKDMVANLSIEERIKKKKAKKICFDGFLNKQDARALNTQDKKQAIERLEEIERRFLEKAGHIRVNIHMLKHVSRVDNTIPYDLKFLIGANDVPFARGLVDPIVALLKTNLNNGIERQIDDSWKGLKDFQALWDRVTSDDFVRQLDGVCKLICNLGPYYHRMIIWSSLFSNEPYYHPMIIWSFFVLQ
jgi:hypothetical protein